MNKIDFYYWGDQCPHNSKMKKLLENLNRPEDCKVNIFDISNDFDAALGKNIFSPTLSIFNDDLRLHGPIKKDRIEEILNGDKPLPMQYKVEMNTNIIMGELRDITEETIFDTCKPCALTWDRTICSDKAAWIKNIRTKFNLPHLGKLHYLDNECVGGAEFVPSVIVPYPIPRSNDAAFLTCVFLSDDTADYKSFPLQSLEKELPKLGYNSLMAIASEESCFPNGPLEWFLERDYIDLGQLYHENMHIASMHLVKKSL